ncbi:hypothetical protein O9929_24105 [Vibrio lentus]|nr:hypothetical protein [Vibrio lentus]
MQKWVCQNEVGVSSSMAAAGLTALRSGSNRLKSVALQLRSQWALTWHDAAQSGTILQVPCIERKCNGR